MEKTIKERVLGVLSWEDISPRISKSRIPYTYHHDFLIENYKQFNKCNRSDVAKQISNNYSEDLLYAGCLLGACLQLTTEDLMFLNKDELIEFSKVYKNCLMLLNNHYRLK